MNTSRTITIALLSLMLIACGSRTVKPDAAEGAATDKTTATDKKTATPSTKRGGYYLDDGPDDNPPANLDSIPDAIPRTEPVLPRASRPYSALGQRYTPMTSYAPYKKRGVASWYGKRYHGQKTSSGEVYDMYTMSGAHTILPLPSYVRVTNPDNGRSVIVRINDRGPFHSDRLIDLSYAAAYKLRLIEKGSGVVDVEAIDARSYDKSATSSSTPSPINVAAPIEVKSLPPPTELPAPQAAASPPETLGTNAAVSAGSYVQVGAFKSKDNAELLCQKLRTQNLVENAPVNSWYNEGMHRVRIGPFGSRADADRTASKIKQALHVNTYVINQP
ncbi:MAG: septal ring lytic transglycosylase RlpA family protein [Candidatus Methylopumilus sp.]|jgi:rare lipoprotein A